MTKKKKRKDSKKTDKNNYQVELKGLLLILVAIIGFGRFGIVGRLISAFGAFLVGTWYNILLLAILIVGGYMMVKREKPNFFTSKLVGLYVFVIGILVFSHLDYIIQNDLKDLFLKARRDTVCSRYMRASCCPKCINPTLSILQAESPFSRIRTKR